MSTILTLQTVACCTCHVCFGLESNHYLQIRRNGSRFFCPNGHCQSFTETEVQRLARQLETARAETQRAIERATKAEAKAVESQRVATRARTATRRLQSAIHAGQCPHCRRHFNNVKRHMAGQHPHHA